jgi:hypothetical protein
MEKLSELKMRFRKYNSRTPNRNHFLNQAYQAEAFTFENINMANAPSSQKRNTILQELKMPTIMGETKCSPHHTSHSWNTRSSYIKSRISRKYTPKFASKEISKIITEAGPYVIMSCRENPNLAKPPILKK